jgi:hypothetical protein
MDLELSRWDKCRSTEIHRKKLAGKVMGADTPQYRVRLQGWIARGLPLPTRVEPTECELCHEPFGRHGSQLDHCHSTGTFRGWLCKGCNTGLGLLGDDLESIKLALAYLRRHQIETRVKESEPSESIGHD